MRSKTVYVSFIFFVAPVACEVVTPVTEPYLPNAPEVRQYSVCGRELTIREPRRQPTDYPTLIQFVQQHTVCR